MKKNKHLTLDERIDIQNDLNKNLSFKAIGAHLGKDCTTTVSYTHLSSIRSAGTTRNSPSFVNASALYKICFISPP